MPSLSSLPWFWVSNATGNHNLRALSVHGGTPAHAAEEFFKAYPEEPIARLSIEVRGVGRISVSYRRADPDRRPRVVFEDL